MGLRRQGLRGRGPLVWGAPSGCWLHSSSTLPKLPLDPLVPVADQLPPAKRLRGPDRKPRRRRNRAATAVDAANVAALAAAGVSRHKISEVLDLTKTRVDEIIRRPEVREFAARVRQAIQVHQLATVHETMDGARDWLSEVVRNRDSKAFDSVTRGLAALEKVAASASGENQRQTITSVHTLDSEISAEARELVAVLMGSRAGGSIPTATPEAKSLPAASQGA